MRLVVTKGSFSGSGFVAHLAKASTQNEGFASSYPSKDLGEPSAEFLPYVKHVTIYWVILDELGFPKKDLRQPIILLNNLQKNGHFSWAVAGALIYLYVFIFKLTFFVFSSFAHYISCHFTIKMFWNGFI